VCRVSGAYMYCLYVLEGKAIAFLWPVEILVALQNTIEPPEFLPLSYLSKTCSTWVGNWKSDMKMDLLQGLLENP